MTPGLVPRAVMGVLSLSMYEAMVDRNAFRIAVAAAAVCATLTGCGSDATTSGTSGADGAVTLPPAKTGTGSPDQPGFQESVPPSAHSGAGDPIRRTFEMGRKASQDEFQETAAVLHGYLDARAEGEWGVACSYLSAAWRYLVENVARKEEYGDTSCPPALERQTGAPAAQLRTEAAEADVASVRLRRSSFGDFAAIVYRGTGDAIMGIVMTSREDEVWGISSIPTRLNAGSDSSRERRNANRTAP